MNRLITILVFLLVLILSSCLKDVEELSNIKGFKFNSEISFPLFQDEVGLKELYEEFSKTGFVRIEDGQPITMVYSGRDSITQRQLISIPPISSNFNFSVDPIIAGVFNSVGSFSQTINGDENLLFPNGEQVKQIFVKSGVVEFFATSTIKHDVKLVFTYPDVKKNGLPLTDSVVMSFSGSLPVVANKAIDMTGYVIDLTDNNTTVNKLRYVMRVEILKMPGNPDMAAGEGLTFVQSTDVLQYNFMKGYLGKFTLLNMNEILDIDLYNASDGGNLEFNDPRIIIQLANGFGMPVTLKINRIYAVTTDDLVIDVIMNQFQDTVTLPYAQFEGDYGIGIYKLDNTNSNIKEILNSKPKKLVLKVDFIANYNQVVSDNFMFDTSSLKAIADVELPLDLKISDYGVNLTGEFSFPGTEQNDTTIRFEYITLASTATNNMPVGTAIQVYMTKLDSSFNPPLVTIVDSIFQSPLLLAPAIVDANGVVLSRSESQNFTNVSQERYNNWVNSGINGYTMHFEVNSSKVGSPPVQPFVKIYSTQKVGLKMGMKAKASYTTKSSD